MDNLDIWAISGTGHRTKANTHKNTTQKTTRTPPKKPWVNPGTQEG